jgi:hypothetical protein
MYESLGVTEITLRIYKHLLDHPDADTAALSTATACTPDEWRTRSAGSAP